MILIYFFIAFNVDFIVGFILLSILDLILRNSGI